MYAILPLEGIGHAMNKHSVKHMFCTTMSAGKTAALQSCEIVYSTCRETETRIVIRRGLKRN
jgi:hypothetical protein